MKEPAVREWRSQTTSDPAHFISLGCNGVYHGKGSMPKFEPGGPSLFTEGCNRALKTSESVTLEPIRSKHDRMVARKSRLFAIPPVAVVSRGFSGVYLIPSAGGHDGNLNEAMRVPHSPT